MIQLQPWSNGIMLGAMFLQAPQSSIYIYSQVSLYFDHPSIKIFCFVHEVVTGVSMWEAVFFSLITVGAYIHSTSYWLNYLRYVVRSDAPYEVHNIRHIVMFGVIEHYFSKNPSERPSQTENSLYSPPTALFNSSTGNSIVATQIISSQPLSSWSFLQRFVVRL